MKTATGNKRATQTSQMTAAPRAGTVGKGGKARGSAKPADKPAGRLQSPAARKDRVELAKERKSYAGKLRALPKEARRAIQIEKMSRGKNMGNQAKPMTNIAEGRMRLIGNVGKRKNKLSPGEVSSIAKSMSSSAQKLKAGLAMGNRGRARYNPNAVGSSGGGSAARKIQGAASRGTVAKPKGLKQGAVTARVGAKPAASKPAASGKRARLDGEAFAARARRANSTALRRGINESDRENALSGAQRRATAPAKRFAASNQRQARADRTAAAAKAFYSNYGSPSTFARRQRQSTANSPSFGSKRRGKKKS